MGVPKNSMKYHTGKFISTINEAQETQLVPCHSSVMQPSINNQPYGTPYLRKQVSQEKMHILSRKHPI